MSYCTCGPIASHSVHRSFVCQRQYSLFFLDYHSEFDNAAHVLWYGIITTMTALQS